MKMHFVYVLLSEKDERLYIGCTENWQRRLLQHNKGQVTATKLRKPFKIIYLEGYLSKKEAFMREKFYKSGRGREILRKNLFITLKKNRPR